MIAAWLVLSLLAGVTTAGSVVMAVVLKRRVDELTAEIVLRPTPIVFDLDAVRAAGDRASLAIRDAQATRVPRRERPPVRHLAVVV